MRAFEARFLVFLILLLFVVRPVTVLVSLFLSKVPWRERLFIAWIAPRGVVAVAITGLFSLRLTEYGVPDAEALIPLSFGVVVRSEEHTSELQSLMRISYAVFCLKKKKTTQ